MRDVALTTGKLTSLFDHAIIGHLKHHGAKQKREALRRPDATR
jgi:hypothetical protein